MTKYQVSLGEDFEISETEIENDDIELVSRVNIEHRNVKMRERLAVLSIVALGLALVVATLIGLNDGTYDEVAAVWAAGAAPLGYILRAYFDK